MKQKKLLIAGGTGSIGTQLIKNLVQLDIHFRVLVRTKEQGDLMKEMSQAEIAVGDLSDIASLIGVFEGIEKAFLLTEHCESSVELQLNFVTASHRAGVGHIVKISQLAADAGSEVCSLRYHGIVEKRIRDLGMVYTFLRYNIFMQGLILFDHFIKYEGKFFGAMGDALISVVDIRDIAAVASKILTEYGHENKIYTITGAEALSHYQMAEVLSRVLGKEVVYINLSTEEMRGALTLEGYPEQQTIGLIGDFVHHCRAEAAQINNTVHTITGAPAISFEKFVRDYAMFFK
ncbi:uncharacterized protein YbjT (DUF2867 family) [Flavobacterium araucananum]|uniref:NmrA-like domain-containing protein n=1 Tax=Flavobacterium araucananum TaxID=946678 RepID=A0A227P6D4_9FLAO|nr:SDR family oxidoreductase [Flavobacterium araucananum]OXG05053.1 hypothetical protein B0A64_13550 [Flavobacterium araucananum]PWJ96766.1 uncharacterized protein YbjT (DUF2867 family) [Flavobacterium araucananum]